MEAKITRKIQRYVELAVQTDSSYERRTAIATALRHSLDLYPDQTVPIRFSTHVDQLVALIIEGESDIERAVFTAAQHLTGSPVSER